MDKIDGYEEAKRQIREALERNATDLHLDGLGLKSLPPELAELTSLTFLTLEANSFDQFPEVLLKLTQLETLYMERNPLERLPNSNQRTTTIAGT
jgi:internalin A